MDKTRGFDATFSLDKMNAVMIRQLRQYILKVSLVNH